MTSVFFERICAGICALLAIAALSIAPVHAEEDAAEQPRIYQVDVIVFRNLNTNTSSETWPVQATNDQSDPSAPGNLDLLLSQVEPANSLYYPSRGLGEQGFLLLDAKPVASSFSIVFGLNDERRLNAEYQRLNLSADYQPVLYATWRQQVADKSTSEAFDTSLTGVPANVLDGQFRLYRERYLHLVVDLQLPEQASSFGQIEPLVYTMSQSRRLRGSDIQYFDHPKFSVISLVTEIVER